MKVLNRPMFRMGGPIKEGIMDGIEEPRQGLGQDISALGSLGALRQSQNQALLRADQQLAQASAMEPFGRLERFGTALTGLSGGVGAPPMPPQQLPNPAATALSNALGIGNLFANIYGAMRPRT